MSRPKYRYRYDLVNLVEHTLEQGYDLKTAVCGNSMEPTAYSGDQVIIQPFRVIQELRIGMIVAMLSDDRRHFVLHRIISIDFSNNTIIEKGDNCEKGRVVSVDSIKGIVVKINNREV